MLLAKFLTGLFFVCLPRAIPPASNIFAKEVLEGKYSNGNSDNSATRKKTKNNLKLLFKNS